MRCCLFVLLLLLRVFIVLYHQDQVYSARKTPVGGAAITTLHYKSDKMSRYITCLSADSFSKSIVV